MNSVNIQIGESGRAGSRRETVLIDLALQGGGSHGAFTWGVLDRLLQEEWLQIDGISGTSAGAMNAAALVDGYEVGGRAGARAALENFWRSVAKAATLSPLQRGPLDVLLGRWSLDHNMAFLTLDMLGRMFSPYDLNPGGANPLTDILAGCIDFDRLARAQIKLFITATNVHTGRGRLFRNAEITPQVLLATACLPTMFQAVEIDGESYWDGGFSGNPTMAPLVRECRSVDTILIQINPIVRPETPRSARAILNRVNEVAFNSVLLKELRGMAMIRQLPVSDVPELKMWQQMRIHRIASDMLADLGSSSKMNAEWEFLTMLHDEGHRMADVFLKKHASNIGVTSTFDLEALLQDL